jgi:chromosome segregation ATPase
VEVRGLRSANGQLRQELTSSRGERDQVQFRLNLLREDLGAVQQAREEGEQRVQELDDQLQEERGRLRETRQELEVSNTRLETAESNARLCNGMVHACVDSVCECCWVQTRR